MSRAVYWVEEMKRANAEGNIFQLESVLLAEPYNRLTRYQLLPYARAVLPDAALFKLPGEARLLGVGGW